MPVPALVRSLFFSQGIWTTIPRKIEDESRPNVLSGSRSRTMILLDPDLDPGPASRAHIGKAVAPEGALARHKSAHAIRKALSPDRVPSARTLARFLAQAQAVVRLHGRVSILMTTDKTLRRLNRQFRGIDKPTDVLSFPTEALIQSKEKLAGDLAISVPTARRQAIARGHSLGTELKVLILHGLLHLAGYDHETDSGQMARRERRIRAQLGLPQGLIERVQTGSRSKGVATRARGIRP